MNSICKIILASAASLSLLIMSSIFYNPGGVLLSDPPKYIITPIVLGFVIFGVVVALVLNNYRKHKNKSVFVYLPISSFPLVAYLIILFMFVILEYPTITFIF